MARETRESRIDLAKRASARARRARRETRPNDRLQEWFDSVVGSIEVGFEFDADDYVNGTGAAEPRRCRPRSSRTGS